MLKIDFSDKQDLLEAQFQALKFASCCGQMWARSNVT